MALLQYKNPQSQILYGSGNPNITATDIQKFVAAMPADKNTPTDFRNAMLGYGVSVSQLSDAMSDNPKFSVDRLEREASNLGITKETVPDVPRQNPIETPAYTQPERIQAPEKVVPEKIEITPNETVLGNIAKITEDRNNPINVQATTLAKQWANKRGLLDSSIELSAIQDATLKNALPIASQDAGTYYDAKKTNSAQGLQSGIFNADLGSRTNMFNADQSLKSGMFNTEVGRDLYLNKQNLDRDYFIANLDAGTKTKIANIDAMSRDSGMMGEISRTYMDSLTRISSDPNMSTDAKREAINNLTTIYESTAGIFPSIQKISSGLVKNLGTQPAAAASTSATSSGSANYDQTKPYSENNVPSGAVPKRDDGAVATEATAPKADGNGYIVKGRYGMRNMDFNSADYSLSPTEISEIRAFEQSTGVKIDLRDVVPASFRTQPYLTIDGAAVPIPVPGSKRADNVMFYIYSSALPKYQ